MPFIPALDPEPSPHASSPGAPSHDTPVAEIRRVFAHFPDGLGAFDQMYARMVGKGRLAPSMRLAIMALAAHWRSDDFVSAGLYAAALDTGLEADAFTGWIAEVDDGEPTSAEGALLTFCKKATESAFTMVQRDVDAVCEHGWTTGQVVEAVTMVSLSGYMTVMSAAGGLLGTSGKEQPWR